MSRYEQPRKSKSRTFEPPNAPVTMVAPNPESSSLLAGGMQNNMLYLAMGVAAISLGTSIFLYRELRNVKTEISEIGKVSETVKNTDKKLEENSESVKDLTDKVNQLGMMMQRIIGPRPPGPPGPSVPVQSKPPLARAEAQKPLQTIQ